MIGKFSGQDVHATGFSIGFERIITILKDKMDDGAKISGENQAILIAKDEMCIRDSFYIGVYRTGGKSS